MSDKYKNIIWGALLHDVGKLTQRANTEHKTHSESGYNYIKENKSEINTDILECIKYHHGKEMEELKNPSSPAFIVYVANNISAANDRRKKETAEETSPNRLFNPEIPLSNIFNIFEQNKNKEKSFFKLQAFDENESIMNILSYTDIKNSAPIYKNLLADFNKALSKFQPDIDSVDSLLQMLEQTFSFIPSSTNREEVPDISLYNHSKITAMLAGALYRYFEAEKITDYKNECLSNAQQLYDKKTFLFISGDISGIQSFIYSITAQSALKGLRGRSFYLDLLSEHLADELLEALELSRCNLLYSGGGHFYIIAQNTPDARKKIEDANDTFNSILFKQFGTALSIALSFTEATSNDLKEDLGKLFRETSSKNSQKKLSRYSKNQLIEIFRQEENAPYLHERECSICNSSSELTAKNPDVSGELCPICYGCIKLGEIIPKLNETLIKIVNQKSEESILPLPCRNGNIKYISAVSKEKAQEETGDQSKLYSINSPMMGKNFATELWLGNYSQYKSVTFDDLAKESEGIKRIGVLRMDVDNLGNAFTKGFAEDYATLSRNSMLSYSLSMFFKREINKFCMPKFREFKLSDCEYQELPLVIVYAGGDDLFIAGAWNVLLEFAVNLNNQFKKFTNGKLTLSAGFVIFTPKYPIHQMALKSGELESKAKDHPGKNAIALFGEEWDKNTQKSEFNRVHSWDEFENNVCEKLKYMQKILIVDKTDKTKLTIGNSMLYKFLSLLRSIDGKNTLPIARLAYTMARLEPKNTDERMAVFNEFKRKILEWSGDEKERKNLITAIYIFVYLNRKEN